MNQYTFDQAKNIKVIFTAITIQRLMESFEKCFDSYQKTSLDLWTKKLLASMGFTNSFTDVGSSPTAECTNCGFKCSQSALYDSHFIQQHAVKCFEGYRYIDPDLLNGLSKYSQHLTLESRFSTYKFSLAISDEDLEKCNFFQFPERSFYAFCCICGHEFHIDDLVQLKCKEHSIECMIKRIKHKELNKKFTEVKSAFDIL